MWYAHSVGSVELRHKVHGRGGRWEAGSLNSGTKCTDEEGGERQERRRGGENPGTDARGGQEMRGVCSSQREFKKYNVREMRRTRTMEAAMMLSIEKDDEHVPTNAPVSPVANQKQK